VEPVQLAAALAAVVLVASIVSVELGITVALIELTLGVLVGNAFDLHSQQWLDFIASFASVVLTFLAGMEVDPDYMRDRAKATVGIGVASFAAPFIVSTLVAYALLGWSVRASLIAGTALSTTSLAVVYAILVERDLTDTRIGKLLMSATFVTDLCTALALTAIFIKPNLWFPVFLAVSLALILALPRIAPWFFGRYGDRVIEPEIKLVFVCLLLLMVLANASNGHAVLPAFVLGLVMSRHYEQHREEQKRLRVVAFAFLTPFFFLKGGMNVSLHAVFGNLGLLALLLAAKMLPKLGVVYPLARRASP
jgi:Kef-type K+ transport system membrane component KefB